MYKFTAFTSLAAALVLAFLAGCLYQQHQDRARQIELVGTLRAVDQSLHGCVSDYAKAVFTEKEFREMAGELNALPDAHVQFVVRQHLANIQRIQDAEIQWSVAGNAEVKESLTPQEQ